MKNPRLSEQSLYCAMQECGGSKFIFSGSPYVCKMCKEIIGENKKDIVEVLYEVSFLKERPGAWKLKSFLGEYFSTGSDVEE